MPDIRELGQRVKRKHPGSYDDLDDAELGRRVKAKYPGAYDDFTDTPAAQPQQPPQESYYQWAKRNLGLGVERLGQGVADVAMTGYEIAREGVRGNFAPLLETGEQVGRGAIKTFTTRVQRDPRTGSFLPTTSQDAPLQAVQARQAARRQASGDVYFRGSEIERAKLAAEEAKDPALSSRIVRGLPPLLPYVGAAAASGGSTLALGGTAAAMSLAEPERMAGNVALSVAPLPPIGAAVRAGRGAVRRVLGRGAEQTVEAETRQAATAPVRAVGGEAPATGRLPVQAPRYRFQDELPELIEAPPAPFGVRLASERARVPGAVGPRVEQNLMEKLAGKNAPPVGPRPSIDAELGKLWDRPPQQQALFDAAARSPWQDSVLAYYRANLLTNPVGRALDLGSTFVNQFADAAARPIAAAADVIVSKLTGKRSITGPSLGATGKAFGSIRQGFRDAGEVLRTGRQSIDSGVDDVLYGREIRSGLGKGADAPVNGVFRFLGAMDAPFRRFGFVRNLNDRAKAAAINESKRGIIPRNQIDARAGQLMDRGDIIDAAVRDGERAVLSEPNRISSWIAGQTRNSPNARLAFGLVQPFMRIPLNAILRAADFSGVGGVKALYKIARGGVRKAKGESFFRDLEEQRIFAQNVAAGSFAPAAFLLGMELEEQGKLEGYYYTSRKDFPNGRVPTSIEIGGERYDVNRLGGYVAAPLFIGATYNRLRKQDVGQANALLRSFSGLIQQAPALGFYGAPAKAGRILTADEPGGEIVKEAGSMTSGFIPASGALGAAAKAMDRNRRREAEGFTGPIMAKIPGLRARLPEKAPPRPRRRK